SCCCRRSSNRTSSGIARLRRAAQEPLSGNSASRTAVPPASGDGSEARHCPEVGLTLSQCSVGRVARVCSVQEHFSEPGGGCARSAVHVCDAGGRGGCGPSKLLQ